MLKKIMLIGLLTACLSGHAQITASPLALRDAAAWKVPDPKTTAINAATMAGVRIVAVGVRGAILLSDNNGVIWHQAAEVAAGSTLTSVSFVDAKNGWAAGHNGVILNTMDGGLTWKRQHWDATVDQPVFSIKFTDLNHGVAVGLWSLLLKTEDGGRTWQRVTLPTPPEGARTDLNFLQVFGRGPNLFIAAEGGWILKSGDGGSSWTYQNVGTKASLWAGAADGGRVLVGGLMGKVFESSDSGQTWRAVDAGMKSSVTAIHIQGGLTMLVGLDGNVSRSSDGGATYKYEQRPDRTALTDAVYTANNVWKMFSSDGVVNP